MRNDHDHAPPTNMGQPSAQAMNPPQYSHAGHGQQSLGYSVSPDLMKIYESLTQSNAHTQQQEPQYQQPPPPPAPPQMYHNDFCPPAPAAAPYPFHPQQFNFAAQPPTEMADCEDASSVATSNSGIRLKKRTVEKDEVEVDSSSSDGSISHSRKKRKSDGQSSKRLTWPDELHRDFVSAIFDVGLKHSSPSALLEFMPEHDEISSERVKSHLQKYRLHRVKSKKEFMSRFDTSLKNYQAFGIKSQSRKVAAHLAHSGMTGPEDRTPSALLPSQADALQDYAHEMIGTLPGGALIVPKLTEAEKQSPLGASLGYMTGLFFALNQHLTASRAAAASVGTNTAAAVAAARLNAQVPVAPYPNSTESELGNHDEQLHDLNVASWPASLSHGMDTSHQQQHSSYQNQSSLSVTQPSSVVSYPTSTETESHDGQLHDLNVVSWPPSSHGMHASQQQQHFLNVAVAPNPQASASRTNLEESNLMKREMQSHMAIQNKMRALKQQELNKTKTTSNGAGHDHGHIMADGNEDAHPALQADDRSGIKQNDKESATKEDDENDYGELPVHAGGETAETTGNDGHSPVGSARARQQELSMGASEEFWVDNEQLFEFLMNN